MASQSNVVRIATSLHAPPIQVSIDMSQAAKDQRKAAGAAGYLQSEAGAQPTGDELLLRSFGLLDDGERKAVLTLTPRQRQFFVENFARCTTVGRPAACAKYATFLTDVLCSVLAQLQPRTDVISSALHDRILIELPKYTSLTQCKDGASSIPSNSELNSLDQEIATAAAAAPAAAASAASAASAAATTTESKRVKAKGWLSTLFSRSDNGNSDNNDDSDDGNSGSEDGGRGFSIGSSRRNIASLRRQLEQCREDTGALKRQTEELRKILSEINEDTMWAVTHILNKHPQEVEAQPSLKALADNVKQAMAKLKKGKGNFHQALGAYHQARRDFVTAFDVTRVAPAVAATLAAALAAAPSAPATVSAAPLLPDAAAADPSSAAAAAEGQKEEGEGELMRSLEERLQSKDTEITHLTHDLAGMRDRMSAALANYNDLLSTIAQQLQTLIDNPATAADTKAVLQGALQMVRANAALPGSEDPAALAVPPVPAPEGANSPNSAAIVAGLKDQVEQLQQEKAALEKQTAELAKVRGELEGAIDTLALQNELVDQHYNAFKAVLCAGARSEEAGHLCSDDATASADKLTAVQAAFKTVQTDYEGVLASLAGFETARADYEALQQEMNGHRQTLLEALQALRQERPDNTQSTVASLLDELIALVGKSNANAAKMQTEIDEMATVHAAAEAQAAAVRADYRKVSGHIVRVLRSIVPNLAQEAESAAANGELPVDKLLGYLNRIHAAFRNLQRRQTQRPAAVADPDTATSQDAEEHVPQEERPVQPLLTLRAAPAAAPTPVRQEELVVMVENPLLAARAATPAPAAAAAAALTPVRQEEPVVMVENPLRAARAATPAAAAAAAAVPASPNPGLFARARQLLTPKSAAQASSEQVMVVNPLRTASPRSVPVPAHEPETVEEPVPEPAPEPVPAPAAEQKQEQEEQIQYIDSPMHTRLPHSPRLPVQAQPKSQKETLKLVQQADGSVQGANPLYPSARTPRAAAESPPPAQAHPTATSPSFVQRMFGRTPKATQAAAEAVSSGQRSPGVARALFGAPAEPGWSGVSGAPGEFGHQNPAFVPRTGARLRSVGSENSVASLESVDSIGSANSATVFGRAAAQERQQQGVPIVQRPARVHSPVAAPPGVAASRLSLTRAGTSPGGRAFAPQQVRRGPQPSDRAAAAARVVSAPLPANSSFVVNNPVLPGVRGAQRALRDQGPQQEQLRQTSSLYRSPSSVSGTRRIHRANSRSSMRRNNRGNGGNNNT
jgi:hypothetical protein